jgi:hypothetical protein
VTEQLALPDDDDDIDGSTPIYRLVPVDQCKPLDGEWMFTSAAFDNSSLEGHENEMSVVLGDTLAALTRDPRDLPEQAYPHEPERWGVAALTADCIRAVNQQTIGRTPTPEERAHGDVFGAKNGKRRGRLKKCATWVVAPAAPLA